MEIFLILAKCERGIVLVSYTSIKKLHDQQLVNFGTLVAQGVEHHKAGKVQLVTEAIIYTYTPDMFREVLEELAEEEKSNPKVQSEQPAEEELSLPEIFNLIFGKKGKS